jgi:hypothetical protein
MVGESDGFRMYPLLQVPLRYLAILQMASSCFLVGAELNLVH